VTAAGWSVVPSTRGDLLEGPLWDPARGSLFFVDIPRGEVHQLDARGERIYHVNQPVGCLALTDRGTAIVAVEAGFAELDLRDGATTVLADCRRPGTRMNDGRCDPAGRFWAGTMAYDKSPGAGALYVLDRGTAKTALTGVTTSNGIDWSPDVARMYYVDTATQRIDVFDFDLATGSVDDRRCFVEIEPRCGKPDGLTVDSLGYVWVALWGGSAVRRYSPEGELDRVLDVPATHPTACAFGGPALTTLFVTTASLPLSDTERANQPNAGRILVLDVDVTGRAPNLYRAGHPA
jgi:sugar lactone lactonase YvrE